jgi:hypothetical protein
LLGGKGDFAGVPAHKVAIGVPSNACNAAGTGYVGADTLAQVLQYIRGKLAKPDYFDYQLQSTYPDLRGIMTWSINEDLEACSGVWSLAQAIAQVQSTETGTTVQPFGLCPEGAPKNTQGKNPYAVQFENNQLYITKQSIYYGIGEGNRAGVSPTVFQVNGAAVQNK